MLWRQRTGWELLARDFISCCVPGGCWVTLVSGIGREPSSASWMVSQPWCVVSSGLGDFFAQAGWFLCAVLLCHDVLGCVGSHLLPELLNTCELTAVPLSAVNGSRDGVGAAGWAGQLFSVSPASTKGHLCCAVGRGEGNRDIASLSKPGPWKK